MAGIGVVFMTALGLARMIAMVTVRFVKDLGVLERVAFTGDSREERSSGEEIERLHRRRF